MRLAEAYLRSVLGKKEDEPFIRGDTDIPSANLIDILELFGKNIQETQIVICAERAHDMALGLDVSPYIKECKRVIT